MPSLSGVEAQYSSNLQLQANLQQQERENTVMRSNILTNEMSQQQVDNLWEETNSSFRLPSVTNDDNPFQTLRYAFAIRLFFNYLFSAKNVPN